MKNKEVTRRQFIHSAAYAGTTLLLSKNLVLGAEPPPKKTAADQVDLGKTGLKLSRLGIGTGTNAGFEMAHLGQNRFNDLIHYAYAHGITSIDTAELYPTFNLIAGAIKGLPREKLFIQSKISTQPVDALAAIDKQRKILDTDYIDSLLIHNMILGSWADDWKRAMDGFNEAQSRKWIRAKGVSCHTLPALEAATVSDWTQVNLVRINPQGLYMDNPTLSGEKADPAPVVKQIAVMSGRGHGVIGMKIFGNGDLRRPQERENSIRFAMKCKGVDAVVIGFLRTQEIDEALAQMNRVLAET